MKLLIMGAQGAGKGTAAEKLSVIYGIPTISTGDLFRAATSSGSQLGKQLKTIMDAGALVPDDLTLKILQERLMQPDCKNGYILDGYPRTLEQAKMLETIATIDKVIYLDVDLSIVVKRLSGRRTCPKCSHIHNISFAGDPDYCSVCGTKYTVRSDDTEDAIKKRLETFVSKTLPIVDYYKEQGKVLTVNASVSPENTLEQIVKGFGE